MNNQNLVDKIHDYNSVLGDRIKWLEEMRRIINKKEENPNGILSKKKIAIIYDVDGWAFHNIAKEIQKNIKGDYIVDIFPKSVFDHNVVRLMFLAKQYDLVHILWRGMLSELEGEYINGYIRSLGFSKEEFFRKYVFNANITTSVYDHNFLNDSEFWITKCFLKYSKSYTVSSAKLMDIYNNQDRIDKKPSLEITDGVDLNKFVPKNLDRLRNISDRTINIGWVGNSKFKDSENDDDLKGVRKIIIPAIDELINEGYNVKRKFADRNEGYISHENMPNYYNSIDLYICASKEEGTPNPILESMACGVPIISTDVGIVTEAFGEKQKKYILNTRTKEELKKKIIQLISQPAETWIELSKENLNQIQNWSWENKCKQFKKFFDKAIEVYDKNKKEV